jgi:uncharacterized protein (TIGR03067 family)
MLALVKLPCGASDEMIQFLLRLGLAAYRSGRREPPRFFVTLTTVSPKREILMMKVNMTAALTMLVLAAGLGLLTLAADAASPSGAADDTTIPAAVRALQGTWMTSESDDVDAKWAFKGESVKISVDGTEYVAKVKADDKAKPYATLDIAVFEGPEETKGKTGKAIYKLDGEKLLISVSTPGHDRPKDFVPVPDEVHIFQLKKQKSG